MPVHPLWLVLLFAIVLIIFGPKRLPELGSALGRGIREFRKATEEVKEEVAKSTAPITATTTTTSATPSEPDKVDTPG